MRTLIAVVAVMAALAVDTGTGTPAAATASPKPSSPPAQQLVVDVATASGSGCLSDTVSVAMAPDQTRFKVVYSSYMALVGVGAWPTDFRKNCRLTLTIHMPAGFTIGISRVDYMGYLHLEEGATATKRANYYLAEDPRPPLASHTFAGPMDDFWKASDFAAIEQTYFPCGNTATLTIETELRVMAGTSDTAATTSFISMDSTDVGSYGSDYYLAWTSC